MYKIWEHFSPEIRKAVAKQEWAVNSNKNHVANFVNPENSAGYCPLGEALHRQYPYAMPAYRPYAEELVEDWLAIDHESREQEYQEAVEEAMAFIEAWDKGELLEPGKLAEAIGVE